jgi:hypothetical protein
LEQCAHKQNFGDDDIATWKDYNKSFPVRLWLLCACLRAGFKPLKCRDCDEQNISTCEEDYFDVLQGFKMQDWAVNHSRFFERLYGKVQDDYESQFLGQGRGNTAKITSASPDMLLQQLRIASRIFQRSQDSIRALLIVHDEQDLLRMTPLIWELGQSGQIVLIRESVDSEIPSMSFERHNIPSDVILLDLTSEPESPEARVSSLKSGLERIVTFPTLSPNIIVTLDDSFSLVACIFVGLKFHIPVANVKTDLRVFGPSKSIPPALNELLKHLAGMLLVSTQLSSSRSSICQEDRVSGIVGSGVPPTTSRWRTEESARVEAASPSALANREELRAQQPELLVLLLISAQTMPTEVLRRVLYSVRRLLEEVNSSVELMPSGPANGIHIMLPLQTRALFDLAGEMFAGNPRVHATPPMSPDGLRRLLAGVDLVLTDSADSGGECEALDSDRPVLFLNPALLQGPAEACHSGGVTGVCGRTDSEPYLNLFRRVFCDAVDRDALGSAVAPDLPPSAESAPQEAPRLEEDASRCCPDLLPCMASTGLWFEWAEWLECIGAEWRAISLRPDQHVLFMDSAELRSVANLTELGVWRLKSCANKLLQSDGVAGNRCYSNSSEGTIRKDARMGQLEGTEADGVDIMDQDRLKGARANASGPPLPDDFLPFSKFEAREDPECYSRIRSACVNMSTGDIVVFRPPKEEPADGGGTRTERLKTCYFPHCSGLDPPCSGFGLVGLQTVFHDGGLGRVLKDHGPAVFDVDSDGAAFLSTWTMEGSLWHVILDNVAGFWANVRGVFGVGASATDDTIVCPDLRVFFTNDILHRRDEARCISTAVGHSPGKGCGMWKDSLGLLFYSAFSQTAADAVSVRDLQHAASSSTPKPPLRCYKEVLVGYPPMDLRRPWPDTLLEHFGDCLVRNSLAVPWGRRRRAASRQGEAVLLLYSRGGCPRRIDNLATLEAGVRARYHGLGAVRTARFEELAPAEQLAAAADADVLVGPHGSGMGWMAVMPRGGVAVVLRGYPNEYPRNYEQWGRQVGVRYLEWAAKDPALIKLCADPAMPVEERARVRGPAAEMGQSFTVPPEELFPVVDEALRLLADA